MLETSLGPARATPFGDEASGVTIVASHGAGGGIEAFDLQALRAVGTHGYLIEQPWRVAGKRIAPRPQTLDVAWIEILAQLPRARRLVVAGRSAGARVACRTAAEVGADAVVALSFPLHPPGKPEASRLDELLAPAVPVLVIQGERDAFGSAAELRGAAGENTRVVEIAWADHGLHAPKTSPTSEGEAAEQIRSAVAAFLEGMNSNP